MNFVQTAGAGSGLLNNAPVIVEAGRDAAQLALLLLVG